jgi:hypothetical protein
MSEENPEISPTKVAIASPAEGGEWHTELLRQIASLRFGVIQVVIHEGRVVQIERTEKFRVGQGSKAH